MSNTLLRHITPAGRWPFLIQRAWTSWTSPPGLNRLQTKLRLGPYRYVRMRWHVLFALLDAAGWLAVGLYRSAAAVLGVAQPIAASRPRRILILQLDHLGDAVLSLGLLRGLRSRYPQAAIDVLAGGWNQELFAALPEVNQVHVSQVNRFTRGRRSGWSVVSSCWAIFYWGFKLRQQRYDLALDVRGEFPHALLMFLAGAKRRVGWRAGGGGFLLTDSPQYLPARPEVLSRQVILDLLRIPPPPKQGKLHAAWPPRFMPPAADRDWAMQQLAWRDPHRPLVLLHVGAGMIAKRWPPEHWRQLLGRLADEYDAQILLIGGDDDRDTAREITGGLNMPHLHDWTGSLSIPRLAAVIEQAHLLVGSDSGPAHLAAAVGTPVVVLFSGTNNADQWRPWSDQVRVVRQPVPCAPCHREICPLADHPCMNGLKPSAMMSAIRKLLAPDAMTHTRGQLAADASTRTTSRDAA